MIFGLILTVILLPFAGGMLLQVLKFKEKKYKQFYIFSYVLLTCKTGGNRPGSVFQYRGSGAGCRAGFHRRP